MSRSTKVDDFKLAKARWMSLRESNVLCRVIIDGLCIDSGNGELYLDILLGVGVDIS